MCKCSPLNPEVFCQGCMPKTRLDEMSYGEFLAEVAPRLSKSTEVKATKTYTLVLNEEEASWLRSAMQNPLYGQHPNEEENYESDMRKAFFNAVKSAGGSIEQII